MKKLLSLLAISSFITTSSFSAVSCGVDQTKLGEVSIDKNIIENKNDALKLKIKLNEKKKDTDKISVFSDKGGSSLLKITDPIVENNDENTFIASIALINKKLPNTLVSEKISVKLNDSIIDNNIVIKISAKEKNKAQIKFEGDAVINESKKQLQGKITLDNELEENEILSITSDKGSDSLLTYENLIINDEDKKVYTFNIKLKDNKLPENDVIEKLIVKLNNEAISDSFEVKILKEKVDLSKINSEIGNVLLDNPNTTIVSDEYIVKTINEKNNNIHLTTDNVTISNKTRTTAKISAKSGDESFKNEVTVNFETIITSKAIFKDTKVSLSNLSEEDRKKIANINAEITKIMNTSVIKEFREFYKNKTNFKLEYKNKDNQILPHNNSDTDYLTDIPSQVILKIDNDFDVSNVGKILKTNDDKIFAEITFTYQN